ncbi:Mitogen-activated protein kinase kinase kinase MLK4 [Tetrabaena socialis]|uniref:Mitogen-activated protein kinase kinase kinase MLK4 n=1 Tax=Tetrabaena socialis TaxID=47790 RepID=A0A2J7ZPP3_9CHLO|nr:Mitogen-activated protein kinase kinase kinase MLK4 [Tetrabaena socialis]|eukprot:PNH02233.1 Mitogen-activated protein kinase kinase kinase MLK4 [Tetrabaena socialis]
MQRLALRACLGLLLLTAACSQPPALSTVAVRSGPQLAAALADPRVLLVSVEASILVQDSDWDSYAAALPLQLDRNVTLRGARTEPDVYTLDLNFIQRKVRLGNGLTLAVEDLVINRYRETLPSQNVASSTRPAEIPGRQNISGDLPNPPDCINNTDAPPLRRCYATRRAYYDVAVYGAENEDRFGTLILTNYYFLIYDTPLLCPMLLEVECVNRLGPLGCYTFVFSKVPLAGASPPPAAPAAADGGASNPSHKVLLGAAIGGAVGGEVAVTVCGPTGAPGSASCSTSGCDSEQDSGPACLAKESGAGGEVGGGCGRGAEKGRGGGMYCGSGSRGGSGGDGMCASSADAASPSAAAAAAELAELALLPVTPATLRRPDLRLLDGADLATGRDIFSFGVVLWEMLSGSQPWKHCDMMTLAYDVTVRRQRLPLEALEAGGRCPHKLRLLLQQCWEQDPRRRPAAAELVKELAGVMQDVLAGQAHTDVGSSTPASNLSDSVPTAATPNYAQQQQQQLEPPVPYRPAAAAVDGASVDVAGASDWHVGETDFDLVPAPAAQTGASFTHFAADPSSGLGDRSGGGPVRIRFAVLLPQTAGTTAAAAAL